MKRTGDVRIGSGTHPTNVSRTDGNRSPRLQRRTSAPLSLAPTVRNWLMKPRGLLSERKPDCMASANKLSETYNSDFYGAANLPAQMPGLTVHA
jgi:hypothetical protein